MMDAALRWLAMGLLLFVAFEVGRIWQAIRAEMEMEAVTRCLNDQMEP